MTRTCWIPVNSDERKQVLLENCYIPENTSTEMEELARRLSDNYDDVSEVQSSEETRAVKKEISKLIQMQQQTVYYLAVLRDHNCRVLF